MKKSSFPTRIMHPLAMLSCLLISFTTASQAQQEARNIKARTLCFKRLANTPDVYILQKQDKHKILLPVENFSNTFECKLIKNVAIFFKEEEADANGKPKRIAIARVKVPTTIKKALFYFTPAKKGGKLLYNVRVMDDGVKAFPMGHTRLINLHSGEIGFKLGKDAKILPANAIRQVGAPRGANKYNMAPVVCRMKDKRGQWRTISENMVRFTNKKRLLIVCFINPNTKQPQIRTHKDLPPRRDPLAPRNP